MPVRGGERPDGRAVPPRRQVDNHSPAGIGEHRGVHVVFADGAFVDGQMRTQPTGAPSRRLLTRLPHRLPQMVLRDAQVPGYEPWWRGPSSLIREEAQGSVGGVPTADSLEAFVEAPLPTVLVAAPEPPDADGQGDHHCADHVDHIPPARAVGLHRWTSARRTQRHRMAAGHIDPHRRPGVSSVRNVFRSGRRSWRVIPTALAPSARLFVEPSLAAEADNHRPKSPSMNNTRTHTPATFIHADPKKKLI